MNEAGVSYLAVRLARLALEVDRTAHQIAELDVTESDVLVLAAPATHLRLGLEELENTIYELEHRGRLGVPPIRLTAGEMPKLERAA